MSAEPEKPEAAPSPAAPPGPKPSKLMLLLLVMNLGASGFTVFHMLTAAPASAGPHAGGHAEKHEEKVTAEIVGPVMALEPFVVNLNEPGPARYIRVNIQVETASPHAQAAIQKNLLVVRDTILSHLSGLHLADTLGSEAKEKLRTELLTKLAAVLGADKIRRVFFGEFVVQ